MLPDFIKDYTNIIIANPISFFALSIVLCVALYLIVLGPEFLAWWVKDAEYETTS